MKDHLILLAKITVTALLLYFLYSKIDWPEFRRILHQANFFLIVAALGLQFLSYFLGVDRWKIILENFRISVPFGKLARITFIGAFFSLFLPSMVGGDFFRAYYLARDQKQRLTTTLTSLILDRSAGFLALLAIGTTFAAARSISIQGVRVFGRGFGVILAVLWYGVLAAIVASRLVPLAEVSSRITPPWTTLMAGFLLVAIWALAYRLRPELGGEVPARRSSRRSGRPGQA